jgi:hypothetical protein
MNLTFLKGEFLKSYYTFRSSPFQPSIVNTGAAEKALQLLLKGSGSQVRMFSVLSP